jgi:hypothetical protein
MMMMMTTTKIMIMVMMTGFDLFTGSHIDGCDSLAPSPRTGVITPTPTTMMLSYDAA